jgi:hypothetical protein
MKRSEMIKRLQKRFYFGESEAIADLADEIIDFLVDQGMQPPKIETWRELSGPFEGQGLKVKEFVHEWEPENATQNHSTYCDNNVEPAGAKRPLR